jgi:2-methylisocitrate lyase-like PEP mutase family enzyme
LLDSAEQANRLAEFRAAATDAADGAGVWINARTDVFLVGSGNLSEALELSTAYAAAGADSLFVPGLTDRARIAELAAGPLPIAVMAGPGASPVADLSAAGVVRISLGSAIGQNLRRGHYDIATEVPARHRLRVAFDELAITI